MKIIKDKILPVYYTCPPIIYFCLGRDPVVYIKRTSANPKLKLATTANK